MNGRAFFPLLTLALAIPAHAQGDAAAIAKIIDEGKNRSQVMDHLRHLTKDIGPRLTGSPQYTRAAQWCAQKFKEFGLKNVRLEQWGEIPVGFERGKTQIGRLVEPYPRKLEFTTMAWTPGTHGSVRGPAIAEPATMQEFEQIRTRLKGAWVLSQAPMTMRGPQVSAVPKEVFEAVDKAGIAGRIYASASELVHTHGSFKDVKWENLPKLVKIVIRKSDMGAIRQALDASRGPILEFNIDNRFIKGPVAVHNVVAEIPGTEKPDEVVIMGGHLDSWNGPGSEGASDNGTGSMSMLEAARILAKTGARPKRTIRFILFSGEEQGLLGSTAYVQKHLAEMSKISGVFVDDGGSNYQGGVYATADMAAMLSKAMEPMNLAFPTMPVKVEIVDKIEGGGSDHASFIPQGVPGFFFDEAGRQSYRWVWHTQNDTLENTIPEYLVQSATNSAVLSYNLACADTLLPRVPKAPGG